jgi:hypothetical protein
MQTIKLLNNSELFIIGDINNNKILFDQLIEQADICSTRFLVSIGNIYSKIQTSESIIRKICALQEQGLAYMIRGSNEQRHLLKKGKFTKELEWCSKLPLILSFIFSNQNRITVVHGGISSNQNWNNIDSNSEIMYIKNLNSFGKPIPGDGIPWYELYDGRFGYIISGHTPNKDGKIKYNKHSCNINTDCSNTGILSGQIIKDGIMNNVISVHL